jgi:hypothetical protein
VMVVWECVLRGPGLAIAQEKVTRWLEKPTRFRELGASAGVSGAPTTMLVARDPRARKS